MSLYVVIWESVVITKNSAYKGLGKTLFKIGFLSLAQAGLEFWTLLPQLPES